VGLFLLVLADFGEAQTFAEDHLLREEGLPAAEQCLLKGVFFAFIALEGVDELSLAVDALGILQVGQVREAFLGDWPRGAGSSDLPAAVLHAGLPYAEPA
jgi:hypothetical protein